jgi:hypothetical protein
LGSPARQKRADPRLRGSIARQAFNLQGIPSVWK